VFICRSSWILGLCTKVRSEWLGDEEKIASEFSPDKMWRPSGCIFTIRYVYHIFYNAQKVISFILRNETRWRNREAIQETQLHLIFHNTCSSSVFLRDKMKRADGRATRLGQVRVCSEPMLATGVLILWFLLTRFSFLKLNNCDVSVGLPYRILNKTGQIVGMLLLATGLKEHSKTNECFFFLNFVWSILLQMGSPFSCWCLFRNKKVRSVGIHVQD
jgi:hypothetical protein